jgi:hypothetical protein
MAVIKWVAARAQSKERERSKQAMDMCMRKYGAALQVAHAFEELRQAEIGEKMDKLMAGLSALVKYERADKKRSK